MGKKEKKDLNPADSFRKELRKNELKKNKQENKKVKEIQVLLNDPKKIEEEITKLQALSDANKLDKGIKDKIKEFKTMHTVALKKQKLKDDTARLKNPNSSNDDSNNADTQRQSHVHPTSSSVTIPNNQSNVLRNPEDSVYFHPVYNPLGLAPQGQQQIFATTG